MAEMENAIFTNMCMVYDGAGNILVQNRRNLNWPGITFPGGHVEHGESFSGSVIREVKEETGLDIQCPVLCGVKQFQTKEDARYVLANATETKILVTMNARSLMHFFNLRCCNRAQWEIREMAYKMLAEVKKVAPTLFFNAGASCVNTGRCPEGEMTCGKFAEMIKLREKD